MKAIAVIGAGPAGSVAAILLARAGLQVTLIEQHQFPRDKVCGECISALGIAVLKRHAFSADILQLGPSILTQSTIYCDNGNSAGLVLPQPMWGISRLAMDHTLLELAKWEGVKVLQPARCEEVVSLEKPRLRIRMLHTNELLDLESDCIVLADGKAALMPRKMGPTDDFGLKAHFTGIGASRDCIGLFGVQGHYGGIAPIEGEKWNVAFSVPSKCIRQCGKDFDGLFQKITTENVALREQMRAAKRTTDWLISPLPRFGISRSWPNDLIPIGNAAAAIEPIGGEGMGLAIRSAELAANAIIDASAAGRQVKYEVLRGDYKALWNIRRLACRAGAKIISTPAISRIVVPLAAHTSGPMALATRLIGKGSE